MDYQKLCMRCMHEKADANDICPHCGRSSAHYTPMPYVLPPFSILNGKYLVGEVLGAGGFGITYIAFDMHLERRVAIKEFFIQSSMYRNGSTTSVVTAIDGDEYHEQMIAINSEKFAEEAKTLAKLENLPGIVRVYGYFRENSTSYMALEFLDGLTLKQYVSKKGGKLSFGEILEKLTPVMNSLSVLHKRGILHRDISPDNIMVRPGGGLTLFDFGGAKQLRDDGQNRSVMVMKKAGYSPIEQYSNTKFGPWTDEYALAATMYFCLVGKPPLEAIERSYQDDLQPPIKAGADISPEQEAVLMKAMGLNPADRYPDINSFREALEMCPEKQIEQESSQAPVDLNSQQTAAQQPEVSKAPDENPLPDEPVKHTPEPPSVSQKSSSLSNKWPEEEKKSDYDKAPPKKSHAGAVIALITIAAVVIFIFMTRNDTDQSAKESSSVSVSSKKETEKVSDQTKTQTEKAAEKQTEKPKDKRTEKQTEEQTEDPLISAEKSARSKDPAKQFTDRDVIKLSQMALAYFGYDCGNPDGIAGKKTQAQITKYQQDHGLTVNGILNEQVLEMLGILNMIDPTTNTLEPFEVISDRGTHVYSTAEELYPWWKFENSLD